MIPVIGVMIGLYILTRMVELFGSPAKTYVKVVAAITALASILGMGSLVTSGNSLPDLGPISSLGKPSVSTPANRNSGPGVPTPSAGASSDGWIVNQSKNPLDDSPTVVLRLPAASGSSRFGDAPDLILRCTRKKTDAYISWNDFMGSDAVDVTVRIGHAPASESSWSLSTDSKATFYPGSAVAFIKSLLSVDTLVARATPYNESPVTAVFPLTGLSSKIAPLQSACGWQ